MGVAAATRSLCWPALGWYLWRAHGADDPNAALSLSGNVYVHQVELAFRVTGRISEMSVQEGDKVTGPSARTLDHVRLRPTLRAKADVAQAAGAAGTRPSAATAMEENRPGAPPPVAQRAADLANARCVAAAPSSSCGGRPVTHQQIDDAEARERMSEAQLAGARDQLTMELRARASRTSRPRKAMLARRPGAPREGPDRAVGYQVARAQRRHHFRAVRAEARDRPGRTDGLTADAERSGVDPRLRATAAPRAHQAGDDAQREHRSMPGKHYDGAVGFISPDGRVHSQTVQTDQVRDDLVLSHPRDSQRSHNVFPARHAGDGAGAGRAAAGGWRQSLGNPAVSLLRTGNPRGEGGRNW